MFIYECKLLLIHPALGCLLIVCYEVSVTFQREWLSKPGAYIFIY